MKKFFQSGGAFMLVALLCIGASLLSENRGALLGAGALFLVIAIAVRARYPKRQQSTEESEGKGDATYQPLAPRGGRRRAQSGRG